MQFQIQKSAQHRVEVEPKFERVGDDKIISSTSWLGSGGRRQERFQVITLRDGKIADMQGFASHRKAERFARGQHDSRLSRPGP